MEELQKLAEWAIPSLLCVEHGANDGLLTSAEGLQHSVLVRVPVSLMDKAGGYRFVISAKDSHADREKGHRGKWALERNQQWRTKLEEVRIVVSKQPYQENDSNTYPRDENTIVEANPNANPQYESLYMYAVVKATITGQGTHWFLGYHPTTDVTLPAKAILGGQTVSLNRWKWAKLQFEWFYIDPDWQSHNNDSDGDGDADAPFKNPWKKVTSLGSGVGLWQWFNGVQVQAGLKLGTTRYKVKVSSGRQVVHSPDENNTDTYGPKEEVRRVSSMYAFYTRYLRWCSTFLRINTIYASVQPQVNRYIGGDCCDVAVAAYRKMGGSLGSDNYDWSAHALAATTSEPQISTVNEPRAGDLVFIDTNLHPDGHYDHTTIFAGHLDPDDPDNHRVSPRDRMMNTNFGYPDADVKEVPPSEYGAYAFIWATYEHFPSHYLNPTNLRIRHLSLVIEHNHPATGGD